MGLFSRIITTSGNTRRTKTVNTRTGKTSFAYSFTGNGKRTTVSTTGTTVKRRTK